MEKPLDHMKEPTEAGKRPIDKPDLPKQGYVLTIAADAETVDGKLHLRKGTYGDFEVMCDEPEMMGGHLELDELFIAEHGHSQEHGVGARRCRSLEIANVLVKVLTQDRDGNVRAHPRDKPQVAAKVERFSDDRKPGDRTGAHDPGERRRVSPAQKIALLWRAHLDLGKDRKQALPLPPPNSRCETAAQARP